MCETVQSLREQIFDIENSYDETYQIPTFDTLPVEIILNICSYLDPYFLRKTFSKVCQRFEDILEDDHLWKHWVHSKIKGCFPALLDLQLLESIDMTWEEVCLDMDVENKKWANADSTMQHIVVKDVHFASVDTVLLINNGEMCVSGSRDRSMALWDIQDLKPKDQSNATLTDAKPKDIKLDAHSGWVWDLCPDNIEHATKIYSASWDNTVKVWDLDAGFKCVETFKCGMSALSVVSTENIVMAGLFSNKILSFDLRAGENHINAYKPHRGPVLALHIYNNMVASISEDKTLAIWDRVAGKLIVNDVKIPTDKACPGCLSWTPTALYIGDSKGSLHLMHPEKYVHVKSHTIWPEPPVTKPPNKITSSYQSPGNVIVSSDRGEIKFMYNCFPPQDYATIKTSTVDITQMRYQNGVMVIGSCESALELWVPRER